MKDAINTRTQLKQYCLPKTSNKGTENFITPFGFIKHHEVVLYKFKKKHFPSFVSFSLLFQNVAKVEKRCPY